MQLYSCLSKYLVSAIYSTEQSRSQMFWCRKQPSSYARLSNAHAWVRAVNCNLLFPHLTQFDFRNELSEMNKTRIKKREEGIRKKATEKKKSDKWLERKLEELRATTQECRVRLWVLSGPKFAHRSLDWCRKSHGECRLSGSKVEWASSETPTGSYYREIWSIIHAEIISFYSTSLLSRN